MEDAGNARILLCILSTKAACVTSPKILDKKKFGNQKYVV